MAFFTPENQIPEDDIQPLQPNDTENIAVVVRKQEEVTRVVSELQGIRYGDLLLDPSSPGFDVLQWAKTVMHAANKADVKFRRTSFAFQNLGVSGFESTTHFQANVASFFMAPFRMHECVSFGKKPEIQILNGFNGVTKSGELLLVLGRPGSGCSTFLKTIAGELHDLKITKDSVLNYNGITPLATTYMYSMLTGN
jgi:ATP-binding cassette, subfamily G (WHITE), member 2, PDR